MKPRSKVIAAVIGVPLILLGVFWPGGSVRAGENEPLKGPAKYVLENYQRIQGALAADSMTGIPESASAIAGAIRSDRHNTLPPTVAEEAEKLADAKDLTAARSAFKPLSAALITWMDDSKVESSGYQEAYCPMADANWLQKEEEINNPYYGKKMLN